MMSQVQIRVAEDESQLNRRRRYQFCGCFSRSQSSIILCMTRTLKGHFDGKVVIIDEPVSLAPGTPVIVNANDSGSTSADSTVRGINGKEFAKRARGLKFSKTDVDEMEKAIGEGCQRVEEPEDNAW